MTPPPPPNAIASERDFVAFINDLNAQWVASAKRLSPHVLTDLYERASREAADWFESLPVDAPALFPVSWAGEQSSAGWFDDVSSPSSGITRNRSAWPSALIRSLIPAILPR